jgi:hypothetical protein
MPRDVYSVEGGISPGTAVSSICAWVMVSPGVALYFHAHRRVPHFSVEWTYVQR